MKTGMGKLLLENICGLSIEPGSACALFWWLNALYLCGDIK